VGFWATLPKPQSFRYSYFLARDASMTVYCYWESWASLAAIAGVVIALILRLIARRHSFGVLGRATVGAAFLLVLGVIAYNLGVSGWSIDGISTWIVATLFYIDFGVVTGAVAGFMAGQKKVGRIAVAQ
jgi:hypothetical protein